MDKTTAILVAIGTLFGAWVGFQQYRLNKRQTVYETIADQTRVLANNNNNILESWMQTAKELRAELGQCRGTEQELRTRISGLETKVAMYRNVASHGWPLEIVEGDPDRRETKDDREDKEEGGEPI